nr:hypothetical protein [uncultured Bilophila sp.]
MAADAFKQLGFLVFKAFPGLGRADVAIPQVGDGTDDKLRLPVPSAQDERLLRRIVGHGADDVDVESPQEFFGSRQKGGRVVVSGHDDHVAAVFPDAAEEAVIKLLRTVARGAGVENVACDDQHVDALLADGFP